jgi:hypothetical protein
MPPRCTDIWRCTASKPRRVSGPKLLACEVVALPVKSRAVERWTLTYSHAIMCWLYCWNLCLPHLPRFPVLVSNFSTPSGSSLFFDVSRASTYTKETPILRSLTTKVRNWMPRMNTDARSSSSTSPDFHIFNYVIKRRDLWPITEYSTVWCRQGITPHGFLLQPLQAAMPNVPQSHPFLRNSNLEN